MGKRTKLGKVALNHKGYSLRHIIKSSTDAKSKKVTYSHTGKFGIYSGKKMLVGDLNNPKDGIPLIEAEIRDNQKRMNLAIQAHIKKMKEVNSITRRTW